MFDWWYHPGCISLNLFYFIFIHFVIRTPYNIAILKTWPSFRDQNYAGIIGRSLILMKLPYSYFNCWGWYSHQNVLEQCLTILLYFCFVFFILCFCVAMFQLCYSICSVFFVNSNWACRLLYRFPLTELHSIASLVWRMGG